MAKKDQNKVTGISVKDSAPILETKISSAVFRCALLLGIVAFSIYANTLQNGYALDDLSAIQQNALVRKGITAIPEILATPYHSGNSINQQNRITIDDQYRPLSLILFSIEFQLFGDNPMAGHLVNIILYAGCVIAFFFFLYHLFKKKRPLIAFIATLLFTLHPIHTEVVANIKSSDELLCFLFGFLSLNIFLKYLDTGNIRLLISGVVLYFLSLLSKETTITFVLIIPLIFFFYRNENRKRSIYISVGSFLIALIYLAIRFSILIAHHSYNPSAVSFIDNELSAAPSATTRLATEILILGNYLKLLFIPYPLISDYSYNAIPFAGFSNIGVWLSVIAYILMVYFGISRLAKRGDGDTKNNTDPLTFGIIFFLVTISIFSNLMFLLGSEMAERFMFSPSAGFCLFIAFIMEQLVFKSPMPDIKSISYKKIMIILIPVSLAFIAITINRNTDWKDSLTLARADSKKSPDNSRLHYFAANEEIALTKLDDIDPATKKQMFEEGIMDYQKSIAIYPRFSEAHTNLANAFMFAMQLDSAEVHGKLAVAAQPGNANALNTLANVYMADKKYPDAIVLLRKASAAGPDNTMPPFNIGICNMNTKEYDSAIYYFKKVVNMDATNGRALQLIAIAYNVKGQKDSTEKYEAIARKSDPGFSINKAP